MHSELFINQTPEIYFRVAMTTLPVIQEGIEQREEQQGQLGQQGHPVVKVILFPGNEACVVPPLRRVQSVVKVL